MKRNKSLLVAIFMSLLLIFFISCTNNPAKVTLPKLVVEPASLSLVAPYGGPSPLSVFVKVTSNTGEQLPFTFSENASWFGLRNAQNTSGGITPDSFLVEFFVAKPGDTLSVGTHTDSIMITSTEVDNSPFYIPITLTIGTEMKVTPEYLSFVAAVNGSNPLSRDIYIGSTSGKTFSYSWEKTANWLNLSGFTGMAPESVTVDVDITGLSRGVYIDSIMFSSDEILNSPQMVICSLSVSPWFLQPSGIPHKLEDVYFTDKSHGWAVGFVGNLDTLKSGFILSTSDGGTQWHLDTLLNNTHTLLGAINFIDNYGWIVGQSSIILHTSDGGVNWEKIPSGLSDSSLTFNDVYFISPAQGWIIGDSGVILNTNDSGKTWSLQTSPTTRPLRSVMFVDANNGWIVGDYDVILHTSDGGNNWSYQPNGQYDLRGVCFSDVNNGWAVGKSGTVIHTEDGGSSWVKQTTNITENLSALYFVNDSLGWVVGNNGTVLYTNDGGNSWTKQFTEISDWLFSVYFVDSLTGWVVGDNGVILKTQSGGN